MKAAALVLLTAAVVIWTVPLAAVAVALIRDRLEDRADVERRGRQQRLADVAWFADLAEPSETPLFAAISLEFARRDLTDESLARAVEGWAS